MINRVYLFIYLFFILISCHPSSSDVDSNSASLLFEKLSQKQTGIYFRNDLTEDEQNNHLINDMIISGGGVAAGDINNDGLTDLFFTGNQVPDKLYLNKGNLKFKDITKSAGIDADSRWSSGVTMADINNDGLLDIYICKYEFGRKQLSKNLLYINQGKGKFKEQAAQYNLADRGFSVQANFFDFDKDGWLDLYLINQPPSEGNRKGNKITLSRLKSLAYSDKLYKNMGRERPFIDVADRNNMRNLAFGLSVTSGDINNDGLQDLYIANDYERPDLIYINKGMGWFKEASHTSLKHMSNFSMGSDIADFNNDGFLDIGVVDMAPADHFRIKTNMGSMSPEEFAKNVKRGFHFQYMYNTLQLNNGDESFSDIAQLAGVASTDWSWSFLFADLDNDGWKDIFITNGAKRAMRNTDLNNRYAAILDSAEIVAIREGKSLNQVIDIMDLVAMAPEEKLPNYFYKNLDGMNFINSTKDWGIYEENLAYGACYADLDNDGDLEIIISNLNDYPSIYKNNSVEKGNQNYLRISLHDGDSQALVGGKAILYDNNELWQTAEIANARGYKSKSEDCLHFGLGQKETVEKVELIWPDGTRKILNDVKANQKLIVQKPQDSDSPITREYHKPIFQELGALSSVKHSENEYDDYERQVLLPYKLSHGGPALAVGDVNNDGMDDFYLGGASGQMGQLLIQKKSKETFELKVIPSFESDREYEDQDAAFLDFDGDGDLDLYVASGGYEFTINDELHQNRLYINNGHGGFRLGQNILPDLKLNTIAVAVEDYDNDGDTDIFLGSHAIPGQYPISQRSVLLINENGKFVENNLSGLGEIGLVRDAKWLDVNGDLQKDLVIAGEWMPVKVYLNEKGKFRDATEELGLSKHPGWYFSVDGADIDMDGDLDLVAGNVGLNMKYKSSDEEPFEVLSGDFDGNGNYDIVLSYHEHGKLFPLRGRSCSSDQLPFIAEKFTTFTDFAYADVPELLGASIEKAVRLKASNFASAIFINNESSGFERRDLPDMAQISTVQSILIEDINGDSLPDLIIAGNLYQTEIETPRADAGNGLVLINKGNFVFDPLLAPESGIYAPLEVRDMKWILINGKKHMLFANNDARMQLFALNPISNISKDIGYQK